MKNIVKNKSKLNFFSRPIEKLERSDHTPFRNKDVLEVYREVMKMTDRFTWCNENGEPWRDILRRTARMEFEQIRDEKDAMKVG